MKNELQVFRDHLVMCQHRLEIARAGSKQDSSLNRAFRVMDRYQREADVLRAIDWVWEAQERAKRRIPEAYFGIGAITAEEARDILLERADAGAYG